MRLINADKLENDIVENITVKAVSRMLAITQGQPTVEAIPIEWIKKWSGNEPYWVNLAEHMLDDWEKEKCQRSNLLRNIHI